LEFCCLLFLDHLIWSSTENVTRLERIISGLGSLPAHGPPLLAWTLATYLARGAEGLEKTARLGKSLFDYSFFFKYCVPILVVFPVLFFSRGVADP
jgi:hypothetical protein